MLEISFQLNACCVMLSEDLQRVLFALSSSLGPCLLTSVIYQHGVGDTYSSWLPHLFCGLGPVLLQVCDNYKMFLTCFLSLVDHYPLCPVSFILEQLCVFCTIFVCLIWENKSALLHLSQMVDVPSLM